MSQLKLSYMERQCSAVTRSQRRQIIDSVDLEPPRPRFWLWANWPQEDLDARVTGLVTAAVLIAISLVELHYDWIGWVIHERDLVDPIRIVWAAFTLFPWLALVIFGEWADKNFDLLQEIDYRLVVPLTVTAIIVSHFDFAALTAGQTVGYSILTFLLVVLSPWILMAIGIFAMSFFIVVGIASIFKH